MPRARALLDSSFLYAIHSTKDQYHAQAAAFVKSYKGVFIIPDVVLAEVTFLLNRTGGQPAVVLFFKSLQRTKPPLEPINHDDLIRVREILEAYPDAHLDFVDCCVMAIAERLNITEVCTFDRRDFSIFRPRHCAFLDLKP